MSPSSGGPSREEGRIIAASDKVLAFGLFRQVEAETARNVADLSLRQLPKGKEHLRQNLRSESIEKVALVLGCVEGHSQARIAQLVDRNSRIVAGRKKIEIEADLLRPLYEEAELQLAITYNTRIWRSSCQVFPPEVIEDFFFILSAEIYGSVLNPEPGAESLAGGDVFGLVGAVACLFRPFGDRNSAVPYLHRYPEDFEALLYEESGSYRRIHSSGEADGYLMLGIHRQGI